MLSTIQFNTRLLKLNPHLFSAASLHCHLLHPNFLPLPFIVLEMQKEGNIYQQPQQMDQRFKTELWSS